jgi:hypothetical protein
VSSKVHSLPTRAKEDLEKILKVSDERFEEIADVFSDYSKGKYESLEETATALSERASITETTAKALISFVLFISNVEHSISEFLAEVGSAGFSNKDIKKLETAIHLLEGRDVIDYFSKEIQRIEIENFGIPHFWSIRFMADYRLMGAQKRQKTLIPVILCHLVLHSSRTKQVPQEIMFQFNRDDLNEIETNIKDFKTKMNKDLNFMLRKMGKGD